MPGTYLNTFFSFIFSFLYMHSYTGHKSKSERPLSASIKFKSLSDKKGTKQRREEGRKSQLGWVRVEAPVGVINAEPRKIRDGIREERKESLEVQLGIINWIDQKHF